MAVERCAFADRLAVASRVTDRAQRRERFHELSQKKWDPVLELRLDRVRRRPFPAAVPRARDDSVSILDDEIMKHGALDLPRAGCDLVEVRDAPIVPTNETDAAVLRHDDDQSIVELFAKPVGRAVARADPVGLLVHPPGSQE